MDQGSFDQQQPQGGVAGAASSYKCPNCTADMTYEAQTQSLKCGHCGTTVAIAPQQGAQQPVVEHSLAAGIAASAQRGLGAPVRTVQCKECMATVSFPETLTSTTCEFCGSNQVLAQESNRNTIRPESILPFKVDGTSAAQLFRKWLGGLWFRPSDLQRRASVAQMTGVYVPYWTFDSGVDSSWTAERGFYYYVTESYMDRDDKGNMVQRTRQVQKVRWEPAWGSRRDFYDDVLVCASRGLPPDLARKLSTFNTHELRPYDPAYLAGWKAEEYAIDLNEGWRQGAQIMEASQHQRCAGDIGGDTYRNLQVRSNYYNQTFKHVLLPIWISAFRYGDKPYRFLVNGQTGEVVGKAPWSVIKIVLFILAILVGLAIVVAVAGLLGGGDGGDRGGYQYNGALEIPALSEGLEAGLAAGPNTHRRAGAVCYTADSWRLKPWADTSWSRRSEPAVWPRSTSRGPTALRGSRSSWSSSGSCRPT
jgi:DNA-directed RNA polymerase subunit RPC12/RpoP